MTTTKMKGGSSATVSSSMHAGMSRKSPPGADKSMSLPKGPSVNAEATRGGVAPSPKTLGPRDA